MSARTVLVTGAAGLVGAEAVAHLRDAGHDVVALTHSRGGIVTSEGERIATRPWEPGATGITVLSGDVREPGFGLDRSTLDALGARVDSVVHSAATVDFVAPEEVYRRLNVDGTAHAVDLARRFGAHLTYVSTAYVCGTRDAAVEEGPALSPVDAGFDDPTAFSNGYERSKARAEALVRASEGVDWTVVRPGIVTGTTTTGRIRERKNFYTVLKLIVEGRLRTLPGRYDATLALAPVDHVADLVAAAVATGVDAHGRTVHAVGERSLSLRQMSDVFAEYPSFEVARFVPSSTFDAAALPGTERDYFERLGSQYTPYFVHKRSFATVGAEALLGRPAPVTGEDYLRMLLDESLSVGYLGAPRRSLDEVLACLN